MAHKKYKKAVSLPVRLVRSTAAIVVLSALVLGISQIVSYGARFVSNISDSAQNNPAVEPVKETSESTTSSGEKPSTDLKVRVAILSDSHEDDEMLKAALTKAKSLDAKAVFYLGDYSNFGVVDTLAHAKAVMDESGLTYYSLPGDHDLYKVVGPENFVKIFGKNYDVVDVGGVKFVLLDNSANYTKIPDDEMKWFRKEVDGAQFLLLAQPVYANFLNRKMGVVNGEVVSDVLSQAYDILREVRASTVRAVFAGDLHMSGDFVDPEKADLRHFYVGAIAKSNSADGVLNLQVPKFSVLSVYADGRYTVDDVRL